MKLPNDSSWSYSSLQCLLLLATALIIHLFTSLKSFPWSDHSDLLALYPLYKDKETVPHTFCYKGMHFLICSSFLSLSFWILSNVSPSLLRWRCQTLWPLFRRVCVNCFVSGSKQSAGIFASSAYCSEYYSGISYHCLKTWVVVMPGTLVGDLGNYSYLIIISYFSLSCVYYVSFYLIPIIS